MRTFRMVKKNTHTQKKQNTVNIYNTNISHFFWGELNQKHLAGFLIFLLMNAFQSRHLARVHAFSPQTPEKRVLIHPDAQQRHEDAPCCTLSRLFVHSFNVILVLLLTRWKNSLPLKDWRNRGRKEGRLPSVQPIIAASQGHLSSHLANFSVEKKKYIYQKMIKRHGCF